MSAFGPLAALSADAGNRFDPDSLINTNVDLTSPSGQTWANVVVLKVQKGDPAGSVESLTVADAITGRQVTLVASQIRQIAPPGGRPCLLYDAKRNVLVPPSDPAADAKANGVAGKRPAEHVPLAKEPRLGAKMWPALTDAEQAAAVEAQRLIHQKVASTVPNAGLQLYETKRFLFSSDLPAPVVRTTLLPCLDQMYVMLCRVFGIDPETNIWRGKAVVLVFANKASAEHFEAQYFGRLPQPGVTRRGTMHPLRDGAVLIDCHVPEPPLPPIKGEPLMAARERRLTHRSLAAILVHETTHGFVYRYRSSRDLPNWLEEGMADWIASQVVPGDHLVVAKKLQDSIERMRATGSLGGEFFTVTNIEWWQYGAAAGMVDFLLKYKPKLQQKNVDAKAPSAESVCFRKFVDSVKEGAPWEEALQEVYGLTALRLAQRYGQTVGVSRLRP